MNKSSLKKSVIGLALLAGVASVAPAQAGSLAQGTLTISNLIFSKLVGTTKTTLAVSDFSFLNIVDSTNLNPSLNGTNNGATFMTASGIPLGQHTQCVASSCPAFLNPGSPYSNIPVPAAGNGSLASSNLVGSPISGFFLPTTPPTPIPSPALAQTAALSELTSTGFADSASVLRLQTAFTFSLASAQTLFIDFDALVHLIANIDLGSGSSQASSAWSVNIVNNTTGATVFNWVPNGGAGGITGGTEINDDCNLGNTVGLFSSIGTNQYNCSGHEQASTSLLGATLYTLTLRHETDSAVTLVVPEPETLMLMGLGLAGLAFSQRRRVRKG